MLAPVELRDLHPVVVGNQDVLHAHEVHFALEHVAGRGNAVFYRLLVVGLAVPAVEPADVVDFAVVLVNVLLQFGIAHLARPVVVDGRYSVTHEVPGPAVDKQAVRFGLFLEPAENFVLLGGQVVAVVHDVLVEVFLVVERPCAKDDGDDDHARKCERLCLFLACGCCEVLDGVRDGERCDKRHAGQHHQAVALVNLDAEVARDVLENHVGLHVVEQKEHERPQVEPAALCGVVDGAEQQVDSADGEQVVEVGEERVLELAVFLEGAGHLDPVAFQVFEEVPVGFELAALESESLKVADGEQRGYREQRERHEERGRLEILLVKDFREGEEYEGKQAECGFLAGLREECQREGEESPVHYGVAVVGPLENKQRERGEEYVERFHRHGTELEEHGGLQCHEEGGEECEQGLLGPGDNREEH